MEIIKTPFEGLMVIKPTLFEDGRGWFYESFNQKTYAEAGIKEAFVQDNHSCSVRHTLRGLHFQTSPGQAKLIRCTQGEIWDVAVDIRRDSPTLGRSFGLALSDKDRSQLFIPVGFAHGFYVVSEIAEVQYKCSNLYNSATESGIRWDDNDLGVAWPIPKGEAPLLSGRDKGNISFSEYLSRVS